MLAAGSMMKMNQNLLEELQQLKQENERLKQQAKNNQHLGGKDAAELLFQEDHEAQLFLQKEIISKERKIFELEKKV
jgi:cell shape-determining protein MreC